MHKVPSKMDLAVAIHKCMSVCGCGQNKDLGVLASWNCQTFKGNYAEWVVSLYLQQLFPVKQMDTEAHKQGHKLFMAAFCVSNQKPNFTCLAKNEIFRRVLHTLQCTVQKVSMLFLDSLFSIKVSFPFSKLTELLRSPVFTLIRLELSIRIKKDLCSQWMVMYLYTL